MVNDVSVLAELALYVARLPPEQPLALRLCSAGATLLGASGASVTLTSTPGDPYVLATTDTDAERVESLQQMLGAGPRFEAQVWVRPASIVVGDGPDAFSPDALSSDAYRSVAHELRLAVGPVRVHSFPMVVAGAVLGVFSVHLPHDARLTRQDDEALVVASVIGGALLRDVDDGSPSMVAGWPVRARADQATGMLTARLRVSRDEAFALIRAHAHAQGTTVAAVVSDVVEGRLVLGPQDSSTDDETQ